LGAITVSKDFRGLGGGYTGKSRAGLAFARKDARISGIFTLTV